MPAYDHDKSLAYSSLQAAKEGRYANEVIDHVYNISHYKKGYFKDRVLIITDESIMLIEKLNKLKKRVYLRNIKGIMVYYY